MPDIHSPLIAAINSQAWADEVFYAQPNIIKKKANQTRQQLAPLEYHQKPSFQPLGKSLFGEYFGVELELECSDSFVPLRNAIVFDCNELLNEESQFCIFKRDGSLKNSGDGGFEICTSPASLEYHKAKWVKFFNNLPEGLEASSRCGMHVHISKAPLTSLQIGKIIGFVHNPLNAQFLALVAGRPSNDYCEYKSNKTCKFALSKYINQFSHRSAVNVLNGATIEIRIFASTTNYASFIKNIEFCHALVKYAGSGNISIAESKNLKNFLQFINENRKFYPFLASFLSNRGYNKTIKNIRESTIIFETR